MASAQKGRSQEALTPKQESFCLAYIETGNASEAYRRSYNCEKMKEATINRNAKALLDHNKIATRLAELKKPIMERHKITVDSLIQELEEARALAATAFTPQASAMIRATMGKAELLGLLKKAGQEEDDEPLSKVTVKVQSAKR